MARVREELAVLNPIAPTEDPHEWSRGFQVGVLAVSAEILAGTNHSFSNRAPWVHGASSRSGPVDVRLEKIEQKLLGKAQEQGRPPSFVSGIKAAFVGFLEVYRFGSR